MCGEPDGDILVIKNQYIFGESILFIQCTHLDFDANVSSMRWYHSAPQAMGKVLGIFPAPFDVGRERA